MNKIIMSFLVSMAAAASYCAVYNFLERRGRVRALSRISALSCPECGRHYGSEILNNVAMVNYRWVPARGHSISAMGLPKQTFLIKCPRCSVDFEFTRQCRVFEHPQQGVLSYTRTGVKRNTASRRSKLEHPQLSASA